MKILLRLLTLGILLLITIVYYSWNNFGNADNKERNAVEPQIIRRRRTIKSATIHYCKLNQYYDQDEGRCLGVPGGGKVLHVENSRSCGVNVLKPHCKSSLYYHICKRDKSILAQCASSQIFDNRLQRCVYYDSSKLTPNIILPDNYMYYDHIRVPSCTGYGRFPVLGHCSMFYTCDTNGQRFYQNVFKCPQNTGYQVDKGVCNAVQDCLNDNSVDTMCVPNAPGENVESLSLGQTAGRNVEETPEILEESKVSANDPTVEREKNENSMIYDIITTPRSIIDTLPENNYNSDNSKLDVSSNNPGLTKSVKDIPVPEEIDEEIMHSQVPNLPEIVQKASDEGQNEENGSSLLGLQSMLPSTTELDDAAHSITTSIESEYRTNAAVDSETTNTAPFSSGSLPKLDAGTQDITTKQNRNDEDSAFTASNFNIDSVDPSTISNVPDSSPTSDILANIDEKIQDATEQYKNNEESTVMLPNFNTDSVDPNSAPTISNIPDSSPSSVLPNINEKIQNAATEQYNNNENSAVMSPNLNTDPYSTVSNIPESSPTSDILPNIDEKIQDATEQYKNNEESTVMLPNFNTDSVDPNSAPTISNIPDSSPSSDVLPNINEKIQNAATEQYKNNEDSVVMPPNFNTDSVELPTVSNIPDSTPLSVVLPNSDEKIQDAMEQYKNNEESTVMLPNFNTDSVDPNSAPTISNIPDSSSSSDVLPNINEKIQNAATEQYNNNEDSAVISPNLNTDPYSTISNIPEFSPISDVSPNIDEKIQAAATEQYKNNEDSAVMSSNFNIDSVEPPTVSNIPDSTPLSVVLPNIDEKIQDATEQYKNNEESTVMLPNFNTDSVDSNSAPTISNIPDSSPTSDVLPNINEKRQDAATEQYNNNEDGTIMSSNLNIDSVDPISTVSNIPESSPISDISQNIDEKIQDTTTEQYRNNEDSAVMPSNFNTDVVDPYLTPIASNAPESSPISNVSPNVNENNEESAVMPLSFNIDSIDPYSASTVRNVPDSFPISNISPNIDEKVQATDQNNEESAVVLPNSNTDSVDPYSTPTVSNIPDSSLMSDVLPNINEKMQDAGTEQYKNNEESAIMPSNFNTDLSDTYTAPIVSNVPESSPISNVSPNIDKQIQDTTTDQNKEESAVELSNFSTDSVDPPISDVLPNINEKMQDAPTEQYKNNEENAMMPSNFNTDLVDPDTTPIVSNVPEFSPISDVSSNADEKIQDTAMEQHNNEESAVMPPNLNTDSVNSAPTISNIPETSLVSDISPNIDEKFQDSVTEQYRNNEDDV